MRRSFDTAPLVLPDAQRGVRRIMATVFLALLPGVVVHTWLFGPGVWIQILLAAGFALAFEAVMLRLRDRPVRPGLGDLSAALSGALFALCLPPLAPWWISAIGMCAAMVFGKHVYGGLGRNPFNPAMVGYAVVLVAFPYELSRWAGHTLGTAGAPDLWLTLRAVSGEADATTWDAIAQATPLDRTRQHLIAGLTRGELWSDPTWRQTGATGWQCLALAWLLGGLWLLWRGVIRWQVPVATLVTATVIVLPLWLYEPDRYASPVSVLGSGGLMFAAWFVATDPVSGCTTARGRLVFGAGVAAITLAIRAFGSYPDGVAFAVLLMNAAAPWIDRHTRPRIHGAAR